MIPAYPNTYVVTKKPNSSEGYVREPVLAFFYTEGTPPVVVTLEGQRRILKDDAVMFPCGTVVDRNNSLHFDNVEEWLEFSGPTKPVEDNSTRQKPVEDTDPTEGGSYDIEWTGKPFKNNSFWHYDDGEFEFCFTLPGGEDAPKQTEKVQKIKRDDMMELKKSIDHLELEDVKNPNVLPDADPEDEDDDDDLI